MFPKFLGVPVSCRGWISKSGQYRTHLPSSVRNYSCSCSTRPYAPGQVPVDKKGGCDGRIRSSVKRCKRATLDAPSAAFDGHWVRGTDAGAGCWELVLALALILVLIALRRCYLETPVLARPYFTDASQLLDVTPPS